MCSFWGRSRRTCLRKGPLCNRVADPNWIDTELLGKCSRNRPEPHPERVPVFASIYHAMPIPKRNVPCSRIARNMIETNDPTLTRDIICGGNQLSEPEVSIQVVFDLPCPDRKVPLGRSRFELEARLRVCGRDVVARRSFLRPRFNLRGCKEVRLHSRDRIGETNRASIVVVRARLSEVKRRKPLVFLIYSRKRKLAGHKATFPFVG